MVKYFCNPKNNLDDFFNLDINESLHIGEPYVKKHAKTFIINCKPVCDCDASTRFKRDFDNLSIRIFEIEPTSVES